MKRSREPEEAPPEELAAAAPSLGKNGRLNGVSDSDGGALPPAAKVADLDLSDKESGGMEMRCSLPPHRGTMVFSTYSEYETHYRQQHTNRCAQCRKNFPSAYFLNLHIEETHDSFAQARRERGERTYSCFVEGCDRKCSTPQKRKMHLMDKHMYPKNFFFAITRDGIDGRRSLLSEGGARRRRPSATAASHPLPSQRQGEERCGADEPTAPPSDPFAPDPSQERPEQQPDQEMEDLSSAMSSLQFVPMSVRFGRGRRAGFAKR